MSETCIIRPELIEFNTDSKFLSIYADPLEGFKFLSTTSNINTLTGDALKAQANVGANLAPLSMGDIITNTITTSKIELVPPATVGDGLQELHGLELNLMGGTLYTSNDVQESLEIRKQMISNISTIEFLAEASSNITGLQELVFNESSNSKINLGGGELSNVSTFTLNTDATIDMNQGNILNVNRMQVQELEGISVLVNASGNVQIENFIFNETQLHCANGELLDLQTITMNSSVSSIEMNEGNVNSVNFLRVGTVEVDDGLTLTTNMMKDSDTTRSTIVLQDSLTLHNSNVAVTSLTNSQDLNFGITGDANIAASQAMKVQAGTSVDLVTGSGDVTVTSGTDFNVVANTNVQFTTTTGFFCVEAKQQANVESEQEIQLKAGTTLSTASSQSTTVTAGNTLTLEANMGNVTLQSKAGDNMIQAKTNTTVESEDGFVRIKAKTDANIEAGDEVFVKSTNATVVQAGTSMTLEAKGSQMSVKCTGNNSNIDVEATMVEIGTSSAKTVFEGHDITSTGTITTDEKLVGVSDNISTEFLPSELTIDTQGRYLHLQASGATNSTHNYVSMSGQRVINVKNPVDGQDATTKSWVNSAISQNLQGLKPKKAVDYVIDGSSGWGETGLNLDSVSSDDSRKQIYVSRNDSVENGVKTGAVMVMFLTDASLNAQRDDNMSVNGGTAVFSDLVESQNDTSGSVSKKRFLFKNIKNNYTEHPSTATQTFSNQAERTLLNNILTGDTNFAINTSKAQFPDTHTVNNRSFDKPSSMINRTVDNYQFETGKIGSFGDTSADVKWWQMDSNAMQGYAGIWELQACFPKLLVGENNSGTGTTITTTMLIFRRAMDMNDDHEVVNNAYVYSKTGDNNNANMGFVVNNKDPLTLSADPATFNATYYGNVDNSFANEVVELEFVEFNQVNYELKFKDVNSKSEFNFGSGDAENTRGKGIEGGDGFGSIMIRSDVTNEKEVTLASDVLAVKYNTTTTSTGGSAVSYPGNSGNTNTANAVTYDSSYNAHTGAAAELLIKGDINFYANQNDLGDGRLVHHQDKNIFVHGTKFHVDSSEPSMTTTNITANQITCESDRRLKKEIKPLECAMELVEKLEPVTYFWNKDENCECLEYGFIAQQVEEHFPSLVKTDQKTGIKSVDYQKTTSILAAGLRDINARLAAIEAKLA